MKPPRKTSGLFLTPRGPYGRRLPERARKHMHASDTKVGRAFRRAGRWISGKFVPWVKDHVFFGAEGEKSFGTSEPASGQVIIGMTTNKRAMKAQEEWDQAHPTHSYHE